MQDACEHMSEYLHAVSKASRHTTVLILGCIVRVSRLFRLLSMCAMCIYDVHGMCMCGSRIHPSCVLSCLWHVPGHPCMHASKHITLCVCILELTLSIMAASAVVHKCAFWFCLLC